MKFVKQLRECVRSSIDFDEMAGGLNKRRMIQTVVFMALMKLVEPGIKSGAPVKAKANLVKFVGPQVEGRQLAPSLRIIISKRDGRLSLCVPTHPSWSLRPDKTDC